MIELGTLKADEYIRALNNKTRIDILSLGVEIPFPLYQLNQILPISQPTINRHVKLLVDVGLLQKVKKNGKIYIQTTEQEFT